MASTDTGLRSTQDLDIVVDADAHVQESLEQILPYMDERFSGIRQLLEETGLPINSVYSVSFEGPVAGKGGGEYGVGLAGGDDEEYSADHKLHEMGDFGIDYSITTGTLQLTLPTVNNDRIAAALANAYNSWLLDTFVDEHPSIKCAVLACAQRPEMAAEEIHRLGGKDDVVAVMLPTTGLLPPPGNHVYEPIYRAAAEEDLPLCLHGSAGQTAYHFPNMHIWAETFLETHTLIHPFSSMWTVTNLVFQGIPERYPALDFVIQEAGIGWIPYLKWRMDDHYLDRSVEVPYLERVPSEYVDDQFYFGTQRLGHTTEAGHLAKMIELCGPGNILYSADLPHSDFDPPEELFDRISGHFDEATVRGIMGETAADVFGIEH